eukprot:768777-Hanusia_phi.AAC.6
MVSIPPTAFSVRVVDNKDGTFSFVPQITTAGVFAVWVQVVSLTTVAHISNSPFNLRILPGATATSTTYVNWNRKSISTGALQDFRVFARDASNNFQVYGGAGREGDPFSLYVNDTLCASANTPTCKFAQGAVQLATTNVADELQYFVFFLATYASYYKLSVTLGEVRIGSAYVIEVVPGLVDFRMCTSTGLGITGSVAGEVATFSTLARDSFGNPTRQFQDLPRLDYPMAVDNIWQLLDGRWELSKLFFHSQSGISICRAGQSKLARCNSDDRLWDFLDQWEGGCHNNFYSAIQGLFWKQSHFWGPFLQCSDRRSTIPFCKCTTWTFYRSISDVVFQVEDLSNPSSAAVTPQYNGQYVVSYMTTVSADYYKVSIRRSGIHILGSPYSLRVTGGITCATRSELRGSALSVTTAGIFSSFWILTRDEFNNNVVDSTDVFVVSFNPDLARDSGDTAITPWVNPSMGFCSRTTIPCTSDTASKLCPKACSRMLG